MKRITILITLISFITSAYGQDNNSLLFNFNIGPSMSNFANRDPVYRIDKNDLYRPINTSLIKDALWGITLNVGIEYYFNDKLSINSGLAYEKKGISINYDSTYISESNDYRSELSFEKKIKNHYIIIPLTIRGYFFHENSFFLEAGFYGGIMLLSELYVKQVLTRQFENQDPLIDFYEYTGNGDKGHTTKLDFGISFGAGYKKDLSEKLSLISNIKLNIGLRKIDALNNNEVIYNPSGTNLIGKTIKDYYGLNSNARNINFTLTFGIAYKIN